VLGRVTVVSRISSRHCQLLSQRALSWSGLWQPHPSITLRGTPGRSPTNRSGFYSRQARRPATQPHVLLSTGRNLDPVRDNGNRQNPLRTRN